MPDPSETFLLTGATGYIGGRLLHRLQVGGRHLRCLTRRPHLILIVALVFLGPKRIPEAGRALGKGITEFKHSIAGAEENLQLPASGDPTPDDTPRPG